MPRVGVRELKQRASHALRRVRERGEAVEVTCLGQVIARRTRDRKLARRAIERLLRLSTLRIVTVDWRLAEHAASLAADLRLRGADATYVAVADRLHLPLVTWDREQRERAKEAVRTVT